MRPTAQDVDECVASGWGAADIAEEFGISEAEALELMRRRTALTRHELTPQTIVEGLNIHRTLTRWASTQGVMKTALLTRLSSWRKTQTKRQQADLRHQLRRCAISEVTVKAICGRDPDHVIDKNQLLHKPKIGRPFEFPPNVSRAELAEDAAYIAMWGHV